MQDRPYQAAAHAAIRSEYLKGTYHQLISMATGTGKTVVFSQLPAKTKDILPGQTLILAHREELIDQAVSKMRSVNPHLRIDKEMAAHHADPSLADIVVASVATLGRKQSSRLSRYNWSNFDKFVTDEAHHSIAQSYLNIYDAAGIRQSGDKRLLLGVTATPQRGDGKALAQLYTKISFTYSLRQAIEDGWLVEPRGIRLNTSTSLDGVKTVAGDYATEDLADTVNTPERNQLIVKAWLKEANSVQTVVFSVNIQHARDLSEMFLHYGIAAEAVWGDDPDRRSKLERHRNGDTAVLVNCGVLTEGYDDWRIGCVVLAGPTKSSVRFTQMVGRGTRLQEGTGNLHEAVKLFPNVKRTCLIMDVVDASSRHSLVTLPTLMGMSSGLDLKGRGVFQTVLKLEEAQKSNPGLDFTQLADISTLDAFIEEVSLFDIKFRPEVEAASELSWHPAAAGGYVLLLPGRETVRISQNLLDVWEISAIIKGQKYRGERASIEDAFTAADTLVQNQCSDVLKVLRREAHWHKQPPSPAQLKMLTRLGKGKKGQSDKVLPPNLDKGMASRLISSYLAGKA